MSGRTQVIAGVWGRGLVLLLILCVVATSVRAAPAEPAPAPSYDLAAMVPHPLDMLGGFLVGNGNLHSELTSSIYDPLFVPARRKTNLLGPTLALLRESGWRRTYSGTLGTHDPGNYSDYGQWMRFGIAEFREVRGARSALMGFRSLFRVGDGEATPAPLVDDTDATMATFRDETDTGDVTKQMLVFRVEHLLATVEFGDRLGEPFSAADVVSVVEIFQRRIAVVMADRDANLGLQALRLRIGDRVPVTTEWYLRRDGRDLVFFQDPGGLAQHRAYGAATDIYTVGQPVSDGETGEQFQTFLFRFANQEDAQSWIPGWQEYLMGWGWELHRLGATVLLGSPWVSYGGNALADGSLTTNVLTVVDGRNAVFINFAVGQPLDVVLHLAADQLDCFKRASLCESVASPISGETAPSTPVASPVAIDATESGGAPQNQRNP